MLDFIKYPKYLATRANKAFDFYQPPIIAVLGLTLSVSILFSLTSSLKHALFLSSAWDMGIFDQAVYLISQGKEPISSFMGFHVLADHAALILYPLALLYKLQVNIHWLFVTQAIALAIGIIPTWKLAQQAGLSISQSKWVVLTYLLYPVLFSANQFHFHPEVFAVPALLWAIWAAQARRIWLFCSAIVITLSCKAVLALTVAAMGIWLWKFEQRRLYGWIAIATGVLWFGISTQIIIPSFGGAAAEISRHLYRYGELGNSFSEVAQNFARKPWLLIRHLITRSNILYLSRLAFPILWALTPQTIAPLIGAAPCILLNMISFSPSQKHLIFQYSLPVLPFAVMIAIAAFKGNCGLVFKKRLILFCLISGFVVLSAFSTLGSYFLVLDNWQAKREAIALVPPSASVLATMDIAPHLSQRSQINIVTLPFDAAKGLNLATIPDYEAIILDLRHTVFMTPRELFDQVFYLIQSSDQFDLKYQRDDVYLFLKKP